MKAKYIFFAAAVTLISSLSADTTATQIVSMEINSTSSIITSGNPGTLSVSLDAEGAGAASDSTTTYTIASNSDANGFLKITGAISRGGEMPNNTSLQVNLASNDGTSKGSQVLGTTAVDLVDRIPALVSDTASITYDFSVSDGWTIPTQTITRTVTLTLVSS